MPDDAILRGNLDTAVQALLDIQNLAEPGDGLARIASKALVTIIARRMGVPEKYVHGRVTVRLPGPTSQGRQRWAKWVFAVDRHVRTGYAFDGCFLKPGLAHSLPPGAVVIQHESDIGDKKSNILVSANIVQPDGNFDDSVEIRAAGPRWAVALREPVAEFLANRQLPLAATATDR